MARLIFTEFDAFAEVVRDASVTMRMCSREVARWTLQYATVGSLGLQQGFEGGGSIAEGATGSDGWTFYCQSHPVHANGQVMNPGEVFAVPPGSEFCLACKPSHEWISVHIPTSLLFPSTPELELASRATAQLLKPPPHVTRRFTSLVHRVLATTESQPQLLDYPVAVDSCRNELLSAARELFAGCQHPEGRHFDRWRRLTKATSELAMSRPDQSPSVAELARTGRRARTNSPNRVSQELRRLAPGVPSHPASVRSSAASLRERPRPDDRNRDCLLSGILGPGPVRRCLSFTVRGTSFRDASEARSGINRRAVARHRHACGNDCSTVREGTEPRRLPTSGESPGGSR